MQSSIVGPQRIKDFSLANPVTDFPWRFGCPDKGHRIRTAFIMKDGALLVCQGRERPIGDANTEQQERNN